jgi:purine-binding chemotaxis protein CheW
MVMTAPAARSGSDRQFVTLGVDREVFAVDVSVVNEILDARPVARIPNAPPFLMGMIDVRGRNVAVLDLRTKLGLPPAASTEQSRILVLETEVGGRLLMLGLQADQVYEVTALDGGEMEPPPEIGVRWRSDYIAGIGRRNGGFVIIFDLSRLLDGEEAALLPEAPSP